MGKAYNTLMEIIYVDSMFFLNLVIDYLLLSCTAAVCGLSTRRLRYLAGALIGAAYSVAVYLPGLSFLSLPVMKLVSALFMALAAYGGEKSVLRCTLTFLAVSAAFGGFVYCITLTGRRPAFDMRTLILSFSLCYMLLMLVFKYRAARSEKGFAEAEIVLGEKSVRFRVMLDTGNELRDPISNQHVMVVCPHAVKGLFPPDAELDFSDAVRFLEDADKLPALKGRVRLIPYSAVGSSGMLPAFKADKVLVDGECRELMTAISEKVWGDGFEGIV